MEGERSTGRSGDLAEDLLEIARQKGAVSITTHAGGPYLVRGSFSTRDDHGQVLAMSRSTVALCRCGRSRQKPLWVPESRFCLPANNAVKQPFD
ncbi:MAG: Iron sulfur, CDGSH-type [Actinobacteria bacterium]|nr:Iron sulfur, CDGSH-type [Actinomycetota bacterium]MEA2567600.1 hypothetical protein [Actinomycetota bacterium]